MSAAPQSTDEFFDALTTELLKLRVLVQQRFYSLPEDVLNRRPSPSKWSVGQCLEHLNIVGGYYLPEIRLRLQRALDRKTTPAPTIKRGVIGPRLTAAMREPASSKPTVSPQRYAPTGMRLPRTVVEVFSRQIDELLRLMLLARQVNANAVRIPNPIIPLLRLRLPDQLEFLLAHMQRHIRQAEVALERLPKSGRGGAVSKTASAA